MKTFTVKMALVLATTTALGAASLPPQTPTAQKTLTGVVSDAMCGSTHMMKGKSDAECTRACVKEGSKYALVVGKSVYTLEGRETDLDKYAGQKVTVTGALNDETMAVKSLAPAKQ